MSTIITTPYTYLIGWTNHNKWYYGCRFKKGCIPSELWVNYFTSSKYVDMFIKEYGPPDVVQVRKIFASSNAAKRWESRVLNKIPKSKRHIWLNVCFGSYNSGGTGELSPRKFQNDLIENGLHNFQKITKKQRHEISTRVGIKTKELGIGIHKINADPVMAKENARRGGLKSAEKCAGFLDTKSENHGSKHVTGTCWWTSSSGERIRSKICPGEGWKRGMKYE